MSGRCAKPIAEYIRPAGPPTLQPSRAPPAGGMQKQGCTGSMQACPSPVPCVPHPPPPRPCDPHPPRARQLCCKLAQLRRLALQLAACAAELALEVGRLRVQPLEQRAAHGHRAGQQHRCQWCSSAVGRAILACACVWCAERGIEGQERDMSRTCTGPCRYLPSPAASCCRRRRLHMTPAHRVRYAVAHPVLCWRAMRAARTRRGPPFSVASRLSGGAVRDSGKHAPRL